MNATFDMEKSEIVYRKRYNIGVATATEAGLIVPVLHDADMKSIFDLAIEISELAELARSRKIPRERLTNGTFTITNFGSYGARMGTPIIRPPEAAIAGFGAIRDEVIPVNGEPLCVRYCRSVPPPITVSTMVSTCGPSSAPSLNCSKNPPASSVTSNTRNRRARKPQNPSPNPLPQGERASRVRSSCSLSPCGRGRG